MLKIIVIGKKYKSMSERKQFVDLAKGVAITGVFLGHHNALNPYLTAWFWSWHIPFFFFITGYCSEKLFTSRLFGEIRNGMINLLIPCFLTSVFLSLSILLITHQNNCFSSPFLLLKVIVSEFLFKETPLWFLIALFWGRLFVSSVSKIKNRQWNIFIFLLLFLLGWYFGVLFQSEEIKIPISIAYGFLCPIFIYAGRLAREFESVFLEFPIKMGGGKLFDDFRFWRFRTIKFLLLSISFRIL